MSRYDDDISKNQEEMLKNNQPVSAHAENG